MGKKFLGIFYKSWWMWLHYVPLTILVWLIFHGVFRLFAPVNEWFLVSGFWFNAMILAVLFIGISVLDQIVHGILSLFGVRD